MRRGFANYDYDVDTTPEVDIVPLSETHVNCTRRDHQCAGCRKIIPRGSPALRIVSIEEGEFYSSYYGDCRFDREGRTCEELMKRRESELLTVAEQMLDELKQYYEELGGCDHSAGICCCSVARLIDHAEEVIKRETAKIGKD